MRGIFFGWVKKQKIHSGILNLNILHTSASLTIQENSDTDVLYDIKNFFDKLVPMNNDLYKHTTEGIDDMPAHLKTMLTNTQLTLSVKNKKIILNNKEHPKRFLEKIGIFSDKPNVAKLIWFHCSSVGEILSIIPLIEKLEKKRGIKKILLTSSTLSSAKVFNKFKFKKTIHQFFPIDVNFITNKFLSQWKPSVAIFVESEIWPNMIFNLKKRNIPLILLNARITKKSFNRWKKISIFSRLLFNKFDICLSQNNETKNFYYYWYSF